MPRKAEIQAEEISVNSPVRRSTRTAAASAGTPSSVKTRRGSLLAQENEDENVESKPTPRTRRGKNSVVNYFNEKLILYQFVHFNCLIFHFPSNCF